MLSFKEFILLIESRLEKIAQVSGVHPDIVEKISKADPSPNKQYTQWLVNQHKKGQFGDPDNAEHIATHHEVLSHFHELRTHLPNEVEKKDINQYKTPGDLHQLLSNHVGDDVSSPEMKSAGYRLHSADTPEEAQFHGHDSKWCTRHPGGGHVDAYLARGPLHIFTTPKKGEKYQFWHDEKMVKSPELKDIDNRSIEPHELEHKHPVIADHHAWQEFKDAYQRHEEGEHYEDDEHHEDENDPHNWVHSDDHHVRVEAVRAGMHHEYPHLYDDEHEDVRNAIIDHESARGFTHRDNVHQHFKDDPDDSVRANIAEHAVHPGIVKHMFDDHFDNGDVRYALAQNEHINHDQAMKIAKEGDHMDHTELANNPASFRHGSAVHHEILNRLPEDISNHSTLGHILDAVGTHGDETIVHRIVQKAKDGREDAQFALAKHDAVEHKDVIKDSKFPGVHWYLAQHFPAEEIHHPHPHVRQQAVENASKLPPEEAQKVYDIGVKDSDPSVVQSALRKTKTPDHLRQLETHDHEDVRRHVAMQYIQHGNHEGLARMISGVRHDMEAWRLSSAMGELRNHSPEVLNAAAKSPHREFREIAARHGTDEHREMLKNDVDIQVRKAVASRGTPELRAHIANHDRDPWVRQHAENVQRRLGEREDR
jgi:hypothetical protein